MRSNDAERALLEWIDELERVLRAARSEIYLARYEPEAREAVKKSLAEFRALAAAGPVRPE